MIAVDPMSARGLAVTPRNQVLGELLGGVSRDPLKPGTGERQTHDHPRRAIAGTRIYSVNLFMSARGVAVTPRNQELGERLRGVSSDPLKPGTGERHTHNPPKGQSPAHEFIALIY